MDWRDRARRQAGVISRAQLFESGVSEGVARGLVGRRDLLVLLPGVYAPRSAPRSFEQLAWAASLWSGGPVSHRTAARIWELPIPSSRTIHVTVDRAVRRRAAGVTVHRIELPRTCITEFSGLPVTNRLTTMIDLLRAELYPSARDLFTRGVQLGLVDVDVLEDAIKRGTGRAGNAQLRRLIADAEPGAQAESERRLHRLLRQHAITGWVPQYRIRLHRRFAFADVAFPAAKLAIEVDGRRPHGKDSDQFESDRARQNELQALGWRVLRFTWRMLIDDPNGVVRQVVAMLVIVEV